MDRGITLETLGDSLPPGTISDYAAKQRLPDTMDIKLKRDVKRHITTETSLDQLVEIAEKREAIALFFFFFFYIYHVFIVTVQELACSAS